MPNTIRWIFTVLCKFNISPRLRKLISPKMSHDMRPERQRYYRHGRLDILSPSGKICMFLSVLMIWDCQWLSVLCDVDVMNMVECSGLFTVIFTRSFGFGFENSLLFGFYFVIICLTLLLLIERSGLVTKLHYLELYTSVETRGQITKIYFILFVFRAG